MFVKDPILQQVNGTQLELSIAKLKRNRVEQLQK